MITFNQFYIKEGYKDTIKILSQMEVPIKVSDNGTEVYKTKEGFRYEFANGDIWYTNINDKRHRIDGPAVEYAGGGKAWYVNGKHHRIDGPAIEWADGSKYWYLNGKRHRIDGPAVEYADGGKEWYINNQLMTEKQFNKWRAKNNPVKEGYKDTIKILGQMEVPIEVSDIGTEIYKTKEGFRYEKTNGDIYYTNHNGERHRTNGPAVEYADGDKLWYVNGEYHRTDGPAVEYADGSELWFVNGEPMSKKQFNAWRAKNNPVKEGYKDTIKILGQMEVPIEVWDNGTEVYKTKEGFRYEFANGDIEYITRDGKYHRTDGPAVEYAGGGKAWFVNDKRHRTDGPAIESANGDKHWFVNGQQMSEKQFNAWRAKNNPVKEGYKETIKILGQMEVPYKVDENGTEYYKTKDGSRKESIDGGKAWFVNGKRHRTDGPAVEYADGSKAWYINNNLHRTDGPAIERADGSKAWLVNGKYHRTDGPANEWADGSKDWYINGKKMSEKQFNAWRAKNNPI